MVSEGAATPPDGLAQSFASHVHSRRCQALQAAIAAGIFTDDSPSAMFMDVDSMRASIHHLQHTAGYPASALHTVAVKANPVGKVLEVFRDAGMGAEVGWLTLAWGQRWVD